MLLNSERILICTGRGIWLQIWVGFVIGCSTVSQIRQMRIRARQQSKVVELTKSLSTQSTPVRGQMPLPVP